MSISVSPLVISSSFTKPADSNVSGMKRSIIGAITVLFVAMVLGLVVWTQPAADISAISAAQI